MNLYGKTTFLILLLFALTTQAQIGITADKSKHQSFANTPYNVSPIRLPVSLAGGFAEIRPNHFHSGLDLRTDGKEGERIYAPADGYVSRINISAWGGGKVLYITHPDGYRTVYMHLSAFCGKIGEFVHNYQYSNHIFAFDIELPKDSIRVSKGQLVALSGNTGGSSGPHLHYEVRYAKNDQTINPLYFGIPYSDPVAPTIAGIKIYPADPTASINGKNKELKVFPFNKGKNSSNLNDTAIVAGRFYCGIYTYDQMEVDARNKNGVDCIELRVDGELVHRYTVPSFMFEETRIVNALIDYPQYQRSREYYILSRHLRGDRNNFNTTYHTQTADNGYIEFDDNKVHKLEYRVSDHKNNVTTHTLYVRSDTAALIARARATNGSLTPGGEPITYYKRFAMQKEGFYVEIEPYTIYESDILTYSRIKSESNITPTHRIGLKRHQLPPHQAFNVTVDIPAGMDESLVDKLTIVCINGKNVSALPSTLKNGKLTAPTRSFGGFALRLDTIAPTIKAVNFADRKAIKGKYITVKIADNLTGVVSYSCYINGEWQLAEHDGKTATLSVSTEPMRRGNNRVTFRLEDAAGNVTEQTWTIIKN